MFFMLFSTQDTGYIIKFNPVINMSKSSNSSLLFDVDRQKSENSVLWNHNENVKDNYNNT